MGAADGGAAEAVESPPEPQALTSPATAAIAKAPKAFCPERVMSSDIMPQCAKDAGELWPVAGKAPTNRRPKTR
ncbi:hypothetical protein Airi02_089450 [Actinoallomurus iriomotensis]|uniref:Uncharacterized protein n=1 Tax=Actinoallomurus iriomotensis TaxID=478107 RepID=A0A9W6S9P4_9ACTN|nr:hypothetical protein Airi02_089450 [Actinoallomurus iriomotensis]